LPEEKTGTSEENGADGRADPRNGRALYRAGPAVAHGRGRGGESTAPGKTLLTDKWLSGRRGPKKGGGKAIFATKGELQTQQKKSHPPTKRKRQSAPAMCEVCEENPRAPCQGWSRIDREGKIDRPGGALGDTGPGGSRLPRRRRGSRRVQAAGPRGVKEKKN